VLSNRVQRCIQIRTQIEVSEFSGSVAILVEKVKGAII
jgi:hypothetical protein